MILLIDNFDSFTYNLYDYLLQLGCACTVLRNDRSLKEIQAYKPSGIVLSPGPGRPEQAGNMMELIDYYHDKIPLLGICLGHQGIGLYFRASLEKAPEPVHGKTSLIEHQKGILFKGLPSVFKVMRYHSLLLKEVKTPLTISATTKTGEIMAIEHQDYPLMGLQFHPESILSEHGLILLKNWLDLVPENIEYGL